jgi:hypothetical protein
MNVIDLLALPCEKSEEGTSFVVVVVVVVV